MVHMLCAAFGHVPYLHEGKCVCQNCKTPLTIVVNDGGTFFGTAEQWRNCFFDNVSIGGIEEFCEDHDWKLEFQPESPPS